jgi:hypothetical protein
MTSEINSQWGNTQAAISIICKDTTLQVNVHENISKVNQNVTTIFVVNHDNVVYNTYLTKTIVTPSLLQETKPMLVIFSKSNMYIFGNKNNYVIPVRPQQEGGRYEKYTVVELRTVAKTRKIAKYYAMNKATLIEALRMKSAKKLHKNV